MSRIVPGWKNYKEQMYQFGYGEALWEPSPIRGSFGRVNVGDVGYVRRGRFHLLFSAGCKPANMGRGVNAFEPLTIGSTIYSQPRPPGYLYTGVARETRPGPIESVDTDPVLEPDYKVSFDLATSEGAALVTKHRTYREDAELESTFKAYTKRHYNSWVTFARDIGHGDDVKPVLVTGVDLTKNFALMSYSIDDNYYRRKCEFRVSDVPVGCTSDWGAWSTEGLIHKTCGPLLCSPLSSTQARNEETTPAGYDQCVFIRYFTMRRKAMMFPVVMKAAAGPHDLGSDRRNDKEHPKVEARSDSSSELDMPGMWYEDMDNDETSVASDHDVIHNEDHDDRDHFDVLADYIFQNCDAESVIMHHRDITPVLKIWGGTDISNMSPQEQPLIVVDDDGVGSICFRGDQPSSRDDPLSTTFDFFGTVPNVPVIGDPIIAKSRTQTALGVAGESRQAEGLLLAERRSHPEVDEGADHEITLTTSVPWPVRRTGHPATEPLRFRTRSSGGGGIGTPAVPDQPLITPPEDMGSAATTPEDPTVRSISGSDIHARRKPFHMPGGSHSAPVVPRDAIMTPSRIADFLLSKLEADSNVPESTPQPGGMVEMRGENQAPSNDGFPPIRIGPSRSGHSNRQGKEVEQPPSSPNSTKGPWSALLVAMGLRRMVRPKVEDRSGG